MPVAQGDQKQCPRCNQTKHVSAFSSRSQTSDGLHPYCRECDSAYKRSKNTYVAPPRRNCDWCGIEYQPKQRKSLYCSPPCKYAAKNDRSAQMVVEARKGRTCSVCGASIEHMRTDSLFCSEPCRRKANPIDKAWRREYNLRVQYGLTVNEYEEMVSLQEGLCAICGCAEKLNVDHCHATGLVRGLLCGNCNHGLGKFKDDVDRLRAAITYLER